MTICLLLCSCSSHTLEDYREEGEGLTHALLETFQSIHTKEQLIAYLPRLQNLFDQLAEVMLAAETLKQLHPELEDKEVAFQSELSDQLCVELNRLYQMESGRALIEKSQETALQRLQTYTTSGQIVNVPQTD